MSYNAEFEILREYVSKRRMLIKSMQGRLSKNEQENVLGQLEKKYAELLAIRH